ncbi:MAG TPA: prolyl oligopeptidase family serine peptidase [Gemmatimonadales bacterium]|nr:prolyl oligopeptidase family serine peptidase [Gemmatimonadales bacterium]
MMKNFFWSLALLSAGVATGAVAQQAATAPRAAADTSDPFVWLEELNGPRALDWVKAENARTLAVLQEDPHFQRLYDQAVAIGEAEDRIPYPSIINGRVYNFWQDRAHVRGIWRTTTLADYAGATPSWTTVLDIDTLAAAEGENWVWQGADCDSPSGRRCLIYLSVGGEDASTIREFDLATGEFVAGGFTLPRGKQSVEWVTDDTLLVAREWVAGELTASGYAYVVKKLPRGVPLAGAVEVFRGEPSDVSAGPFLLTDGQGQRAVGVRRGVSFFESERRLFTPAGLLPLNMPLKSGLVALVRGRMLVRLSEPWTAGGAEHAAGSLVSVELSAAMAHPGSLQPTPVYVPGPRETLGSIAATRDRLLVTSYENVRGRASVYIPKADGGWLRRPLDLRDNSSISIVSTDEHKSDAFLTVTGFLAPTTLVHVNADAVTWTVSKTTAPKFDAAGLVVEQLEATSADGTKVPYFVVRRTDVRLDGSSPTILYAYGGFQASMTPSYNPNVGKLWLERGGVYALANIRGGGEFGPAWHEAGLKTKRQVVYDDFTAVARDLVKRKLTTPKRLGIMGGSNGGLLMGVEFTQHPELFGAVDIQVPLLDMLRYEQIQAGASWVGEYGSVSVPEERAFLASISPYSNLRPGVKYPEPFIWTTTRDDRVGPQHARKFAARLSAMGIPYLFYEVIQGGHGSGANIKERAFTNALEYTYFTRRLMDAERPSP